jgi:hypothetical protein
MNAKKVCKVCLRELELSRFKHVRSGVRRGTCKRCKRRMSPDSAKRQREWDSARQRAKRADPENLAKVVLGDSKKSDRKRGFENDLTLEFVKKALSSGCDYCGERTLRMTLDRIDNAVGHILTNVRPACIRCNYARGSMPYDAWLCLVPGMIAARRLGVFGRWTGRARSPGPPRKKA